MKKQIPVVMLDSSLEVQSKAKSSDEPMEDWYLKGIEVLEHRKRVAELKKRSNQSAGLTFLFHVHLLSVVVFLILVIWSSVQEFAVVKTVEADETSAIPFSLLIYGFLLYSAILGLISNIEEASIKRTEACLELIQLKESDTCMSSSHTEATTPPKPETV